MHASLFKCLTAEQLNVCENIMTAVQLGGFFFLIRIWRNMQNIYVENNV